MVKINILYNQLTNGVHTPYVVKELNNLKNIYKSIRESNNKNNINKQIRTKLSENMIEKSNSNNSININKLVRNESIDYISIYNQSFHIQKRLTQTNSEYAIYKFFTHIHKKYNKLRIVSFYTMFNLNNSRIDIEKIKDFIKNIYISTNDYNNQVNFYNSLNKISKYAFNYHKKDPDTFSRICRNSNVNSVKSKIVNSESTYLMNRLKSTSFPKLRLMNRLYNLFYYVPILTKDIYVYRIENNFSQSAIHQYSNEYTFRGFISTTNDPIVATTFNKMLRGSNQNKSIFLLWVIKIPAGSRVIIPSIGYMEDDSEVEILLKDNTKVNNIIRMRNINKVFTDLYPSNVNENRRTTTNKINVKIENMIVCTLVNE